MMTTHDELEAKFQNKEISFEDYMETPVAQKPLEIKPSKLRGRRVAQRQGQLVAKALEPQGAPGGVVRLLAPNGPGYYEFNLNSNPATIAAFNFQGGVPNSSPMPIERSTAEKLIQDMQPLGWAKMNLNEAPKEDAEAPEGFVPAPGNLKTVEVAKRFILAGNAYLTVRSLASGTRYTFRVSKGEAREGYCKWCGSNPCTCVQPYFVSYLAGPENSSDYIYLGWIKDGKFATTKASARLADSQVFKAFRWVWEHLQNNQLPPKTEVWHEGRCGACGRKLTVPESIESGIGPVCAEKGGF